MQETTVSKKYQIVIPKKTREKVGLKEGQKVYAYATKDNNILLSVKRNLKWPDDYIGSEADIWKDIDVAEYLREERGSWDDD